MNLSDTRVCQLHGKLMLLAPGAEGLRYYCPYPGCPSGTAHQRIEAVEQGAARWYVRTMPQPGVYQWKPMRSKGRCLPCEKVRQTASN